jgi:hypothetical protein
MHASRLGSSCRARPNHAIIESEAHPEKILNALKSYASRNLNRSGIEDPNRKRWARHGSARWLWTDEEVRQAVRYVIKEQGEPMTTFIADGI